MSIICALLQDYGFCHVQHLRRLTTVNAQVLCLSEHFLILIVTLDNADSSRSISSITSDQLQFHSCLAVELQLLP